MATAYIVWNSDRSEGVVFVDRGDNNPGWPTSKQDARQAATGKQAIRGIGSSIAEAFQEFYGGGPRLETQEVDAAALDALR